MSAPAWGAAPDLSLGVEEELFLLDAETLMPGTGAQAVVEGRHPRLKTELFQCLVETTTGVCADAAAALEELRALRREAAGRAAEHGLVLAASGTHPLARPEEQPIVPEERYETMVAELGEVARRQLVCGLHVHVAMRSADACLRALEGVLPWLPPLLALSANSPYLAGAPTGRRSTRAAVLLELPHAGAPPPLPSPRAWAEHVAATGRDYTRLWWDVRPHPRLGTLEVRIADQQTDVSRSAGIAAVVQALVAAADGGAAEPLDRDRYAAERERASRGEFVLDGLAERAEEGARGLGTWRSVEAFLARPAEAERQLALAELEGLRAVCADLVERSVG